jgi:2,5-furandicarboxylate decarboxylase 1
MAGLSDAIRPRSGEAADLAGFLRRLEGALPEAVLVVERPLALRWEITALQHGLEHRGRYPVLLVEQPRRDDGSISAVPVVTNLMASRRVAAAVLGVDDHRRAAPELASRLAEGAEIPPVVVARSDAPVYATLREHDDADLGMVPALVQHRLDPGPYLSAAHATTFDPVSGVDNTAIQRAWVRPPRELRYFPYPSSHNWANVRAWWSRGEDAPIAFWIGHHPAIDVGANQKIGYPESHWGKAGSLTGVPVRLTPTVTFGDALMVPADAECVLEGWVRRDAWRAEGPFGEYTGYSGPQRPSPVVDIEVIATRASWRYHDYASGLADMLVPDNLLHEATVFAAVRREVPSLVNVHVPSSARRFHAYLQLDHPAPGEARRALELALANRRVKHAVALDVDVDLFDERSVAWAIATRVQWSRDAFGLRGGECSTLDPSLPPGATTSDKAGLDATLPSPVAPGLPPPVAPVSEPGGGLDPGRLVDEIVGQAVSDLVAE